MSPLRIVGLVIAAILVYMVARGLARRSPVTGDLLALAAALLLALVALFPSAMNLPTELIDLGLTRGRRLIALLTLSNLALWPYLIWSNERHRKSAQDIGHQIEVLVERLAAGGAPEHVGPIAVVIPAYDEERTVGAVVRGLPDTVQGERVQAVVVADGCHDATAAEARRAGAIVLDLPINRGGGAAIRLGYAYAARAGARVIVTMDADGQHRPDDLEALVAPVLEDEADFVVGSRRLGTFERVSTLRALGLNLLGGLLNLLLATRLTDCSSGFRAFDATRLPALTTHENQYHTAETIILVRRRGLRVAEVPITAPRRIAGTTKKGGDFVYGYRFARALLTHWLRG